MADVPSSSSSIFKEPQLPLATPSATPPISPRRPHPSRDLPPPPKRPRLASTPSSLPSLSFSRSTPSSSSSITNEELYDARRQSALRVLNVWSRLEERYTRGLDEDDIIDLHHGLIVKDKGVLQKYKKIHFGSLADSVRSGTGTGDEDEPSATEEEVEDDDDSADEIDAFAPGADLKLEMPRRFLPPIGEVDPADKNDLEAFLNANRRMQERGEFDEEDEGSIADVLRALADGISSSEEVDDGYTSFEEDLAASDPGSVPPTSSSPPSSAPGTPARRVTVRPYNDDDLSEDEFAKWEPEEDIPISSLKTPQPQRKPTTPPREQPEIIDLTSPSPPATPQTLPTPTPRARSQPPPSFSSSKSSDPKNYAIARAKSKTPGPSSRARSKTPARGKSKTPAPSNQLASLSVTTSTTTLPSASTSRAPTRGKSKSKTPAREVRADSPPVASSSKVKLPASTKLSRSLASLFDDDPEDNPFLDHNDTFPLESQLPPPRSVPESSPAPAPVPAGASPTYIRPKPRHRQRRGASVAPSSNAPSDLTDEPNQPQKDSDHDYSGPRSPSPALDVTKTTSATKKAVSLNGRKKVEVVITRYRSRAPSIPPPPRTPRTPSPPLKHKHDLRDRNGAPASSTSPGSPKANRKTSIPLKTSNQKQGPNTGIFNSALLLSDLTISAIPARVSSSELREFESPVVKRGRKRKLALIFSSDEDESDPGDVPLASSSPVKLPSSPVKPRLSTKPPSPESKGKAGELHSSPKRRGIGNGKAREGSNGPPPSPKGKIRRKEEVVLKPTSSSPKSHLAAKAQARKPRAKSQELVSDSEPDESPKTKRSSSRAPPSPARGSSQPLPVTRYPYPTPHTPQRKHRSRSSSRGHEQPHPSNPPSKPLSVFDPEAQYHFAQAVHHLAYLVSGVDIANGGIGNQIPWPRSFMPSQQLPRQSRHAAERSSSPLAGPSRHNRNDATSTPTHTSHPYPHSYDPTWSSSTLPPSSPPQSSPLPSPSPPTSPVPLRPALRERSRSRGRRVSFKLGDDDRPHVRPGDDDDNMEPSTPDRDRLAILASPEIPVATPPRSRRRDASESPCPSPSKARRGTPAAAQAARLGVDASLPHAGGRERAQTPAPPERKRK